MALTAAEKQKAYRARKRAAALQQRAERTCEVCGNPLQTDTRADQRYCSHRCRQRLLQAGGQRTRGSEVYGWKWAATETRRKARNGEQPTKEQEKQAHAWEVWKTCDQEEALQLKGALELEQLQRLVALRKEVARAATTGKGRAAATKSWRSYIQQLQQEQEEAAKQAAEEEEEKEWTAEDEAAFEAEWEQYRAARSAEDEQRRAAFGAESTDWSPYAHLKGLMGNA